MLKALSSSAFKFHLFGLTGLYLYGQNDNVGGGRDDGDSGKGGIKLKMDPKQEQGHFIDHIHKV
jgi:hypothetical protein